MMDPKTALDEVVHVLHDIEVDPKHAAEHGAELAEAVEHLRDAEVEVPASLESLNQSLSASANQHEAEEEVVEHQFDNMPI